MLLSAGPLRTFPPSQTALQMVRGWARWSAAATPPAPDLSLYVVSPTILQDLDSGRLDLQSGLDPDVVDFWLDVVTRDEDEHRFRVVERVTSSLRAMLADRHVRHPDWALTLTPAPSLDWDGWTLRGVDAWERSVGGDLSLETFGILPGSTLRVTEPSPETVPREAATMPRSWRGP
jgi:hypothetical protein